MILAINTLIPSRDKSQGIYLFQFLGFFWLDLKHSTGTSLSMPEMNHISLLGGEIPNQRNFWGILSGLPKRRGHGGTDKASFSLILCLGRAANKATSNLHTTRRLISDSQGGPTGPEDQRGCRELTYPYKTWRALEVKPVSLLHTSAWPYKSSLQTMTKKIFFFFWLNKRQPPLNGEWTVDEWKCKACQDQ